MDGGVVALIVVLAILVIVSFVLYNTVFIVKQVRSRGRVWRLRPRRERAAEGGSFALKLKSSVFSGVAGPVGGMRRARSLFRDCSTCREAWLRHTAAGASRAPR